MNRRFVPSLTRARTAAMGLCLLASGPEPARGDAPVVAYGDQRAVLPARPLSRPTAARYVLDAPLPRRPWTNVQRVTRLPGFVTTPPLVLANGDIVVGVASPASIAWIDPTGNVRTVASLDDHPTGELAVGADGRILVAVENHYVDSVAPDGTVRNQVRVERAPMHGPIANADGSTMIVFNPPVAGAEVTVLSAAGETLSRRTLPRALADLTVGSNGSVWLLGPAGVVNASLSGALVDAGFGRGATHLMAIGDGSLALLAGGEIQVRSTRGAVRGTTEVGAVQWMFPLPSGGLAVLRTGPPEELCFLGPDASVVSRIPLPASARIAGISVDSSGAFAALAADGAVTAMEPDGAVRWSFSLQEPVAQPPVPLVGGGIAVVFASGAMALVR